MKFENPEVEAVFCNFSADMRRNLLDLRALIFATAATTPGVGSLVETLKWGQPSYLTTGPRSGSTIRIDAVKSAPYQYAMYFHCQTTLVDTFRELYPDIMSYTGNRAIVFDAKRKIPEAELRHCIALALTYHLDKVKN